MDLLGGRIRLNPRPSVSAEPPLGVALLGHCPGRARPERLRAGALAEVRRIGYVAAADRLASGGELPSPLAELHHLPLALRSIAEFEDLFPEARTRACAHGSPLAGRGAWLPQAVEDFFANGGECLWVVRIPESEQQRGFLPPGPVFLNDVEALRGLQTVLVIPELGVVGLPDLERLQLPADLADVPPLEQPLREPAFLPCARPAPAAPALTPVPAAAATPRPTGALLGDIGTLLARHRPDLLCLYSLPLDYSRAAGGPRVDDAALAQIESLKLSAQGHDLRRVQLLAPYLRGLRYRLGSAVGLVAGLQAATARRQGVWRSVAGIPMLTEGKPYPRVTARQAARLAATPGVGVLSYQSGRVSLQDERLAVPFIHGSDYVRLRDKSRLDGYRSGEVARFMGFLMRQLRDLGEIMVFAMDFRDPRPRLLLEAFFRRLYRAGALRGRLPQDSFSIRERRPRQGAVVYDIEVAPAFPIDRVHLTFSNRTGAWQAEVNHV